MRSAMTMTRLPDDQPLMVYVTCSDEAEARALAEAVIPTRLAACANILMPVRSLYLWEGKLADEAETVLVLKTRAGRFEELKSALVQAHSYDTPCIVAWPLAAGHPAFLSWVIEETSGERAPSGYQI